MVVEQVREMVRAGGLLARGRVGGHPVLVMLSGGRDSTCLLDVAVALLGPASVEALHVNYRLRPRADEDERHCLELCRELSVQLHVVRADSAGAPSSPAASVTGACAQPAAHAQQPAPQREDAQQPAPGNLHAWARELRYAHARRIAEPRDMLIAAAHTASDQLETILYRLAASPGRRALLGMPERDGRLIRPLLGVSRERTTAYCRERGLRWREDESNADERYARARVRSGVVPALGAVHPAAHANVLRTAALLREETELLDRLVEHELAGADSISIARLRQLPAALARMVVVRLAEDATGSYVPQAGNRVGELLALAQRRGRAELHLGGRAAAVVEHGRLRIIELPPRA